jgi:1,4-alpha-glucan branching enzyme
MAAFDVFAAAEPAPGPAGIVSVVHAPDRASAPVRFVLRAEEASHVEIAGDFNGWVPAPLVRRPDGFFEAVVPLPPGRYEYAFCVDGAWGPDPAAHRYVEDGFGGKNSVIEL